jgi:hypothetical protein
MVTGLAWGQVSPPGSSPASSKENTLTIQESDKPPLKCKIIRSWQESDGRKAYDVQAVRTGEMITVVQPAPGAAGSAKTAATKIYHWGDDNQPPADAPRPPKDAAAKAPASAAVPSSKASQPSKATVAKAQVSSRQWPPAYQPEIVDPEPAKVAPPAVVRKPAPGVEVLAVMPHKDRPVAAAPTRSPLKDAEPKKTVVAKDPGASTKPTGPVIINSSKADIARADAPKSPAVTNTGTPQVITTPQPLPIIVQGAEADKQPEAKDLPPLAKPGRDDGSSTVVRVPSKVVTKGPEPTVTATQATVPTPPKKAVADEQPTQGPALAQNAPTTAPSPNAPTARTGEGSPNRDNNAVPAKATNEPAASSDWRQSWGRVEPQPTVAKTDPPRKTDVPNKLDLPRTSATKPDPFVPPNPYAKQPATDSSKPVQAVKNTQQPEGGSARLMPVPDVKKPDNGTTPAPMAGAPLPLPLGMGSVAAAQGVEVTEPAPGGKQPPPQAMAGAAWEGGNAFTPAPQTKTSGQPVPPPVASNAPPAQMLPPMPPPPSMVMIPMDRGVPSGMANAFTNGGSARPLPSEFGEPGQPGNAFSGTTPNMAPPQPVTAPGRMVINDRRAAPMPPQAPVVMDHPTTLGTNVAQLLAVLRDSLYPSQREWAAETLAGQRGVQSQPQVVQGLLNAAKDDPAPSVRAGCVRAIAQLQVNTVPAVALVQSLKNDPDPRVRREAEQALPALTGGQPMPLDPSVRPASGR